MTHTSPTSAADELITDLNLEFQDQIIQCQADLSKVTRLVVLTRFESTAHDQLGHYTKCSVRVFDGDGIDGLEPDSPEWLGVEDLLTARLAAGGRQLLRPTFLYLELLGVIRCTNSKM